MSDRNSQSSGRASRIIGVILMILGILLLSAAGLCTLIFWAAMFPEGADLDEMGVVLAYSGVPMLVGGLVTWGGYALWRKGAAK